jgi:sulfur transfer complex TusBCD TusB component (DsrH family)
MAKYLLIQSKSPWESGDSSYFYDLAHNLASGGNDVTFVLVQNGVLAARKGANDVELAKLVVNVRVFADDFSLRERAIPTDGLKDGVKTTSIDTVVDLLAEGAKAIWH